MTLRSIAAILGTVLLLTASTAQVGLSQRAPAPMQTGLVAPEPSGFARARAAGLRAVKILVDWSVVEARRGEPSWAAVERAVAAAQQEGLSPVLVLAFTPQWASIATGVELQQPAIYTRQPAKDARDWERFVTATATRYSGRVREWQVWTQLGLPHFRGTGSEYLTLLQTARARLRAVDQNARVAIATPAGMDLNFIVSMLGSAGAFDVVSLAPQGLSPEMLLRPLAVASARARNAGKALWIDWSPEQGVAADGVAGPLARIHAVAQAAGVERLFIADLDRVEPALRQVATALGPRVYAGYLMRDPGMYVTVFVNGTDAAALAWTRGEARALELPAATEMRVVAIDGQAQPPEVRENRAVVRVGEGPVLITGLPSALVEEARTNASSGPLLPRPSRERDYSASPEVSARLGRVGEERGLYNVPFRTRRTGAVEPVEVDGVEAVRTNVSRDVFYVYFDVDDTFVFFGEGRAPVDIIVEVRGARAAQQLGFNVLYDSTTGYRFTSWQWVEAKDGWVTYTIRLTDASFSNTWGWDFALNAAGNRAEDLTVRSVTVRKGAP